MEITLTERYGFLWRKTRTRTYRGEVTVWHDVQTGRRPHVSVEKRLSELAWLRKQQDGRR